MSNDSPRAPQPMRTILELGDDFYDAVDAAEFPAHILRYRNNRAAQDIHIETLDDAEWLRHFGELQSFAGSIDQHLALRYHGHQFRIHNPELGDGRGFVLAQFLDDRGRLLDLGTKGSGRTPWSRFGDGRLTLKGGVREILAAEMLEALGVTTARALSLVETGEALVRHDEPSPTRSAVLVRLAHSHIRYGTFQRLAALGHKAEMQRLVDYVLAHIAQTDAGADPFATLMDYAVRGAARLVAEWHVAGFVHGVLNTDNMNISGESFDYGPWRFLPRFDARFTAAYFDESGLYAFGRIAESIQWNLIELAKALRLIAPAESLIPALKQLPVHLNAEVRRQALWRLGLERRDADAEASLISSFEAALSASPAPPDAAWFAFRGGRTPPDMAPEFHDFANQLQKFTPREGALSHPYWQQPGPETLLIDEVEALWDRTAAADDWSALNAKCAAIRAMGAAHR